MFNPRPEVLVKYLSGTLVEEEHAGFRVLADKERIIEYTGQNPDSGNIFIDSNGDVYMAVYNKATGDCATKNPGDKKVTLTKKDPSECKLDKSPC